ncbi:MAG: aminotransferase class I/II-fold pyridoxal phosphate-dependent enzyme, partial [Planctomycetota bacterium]
MQPSGSPKTPAGLSQRGDRLADQSPMADYIVEHFSRAADAPEASSYTALCIAENSLVHDLVVPQIEGAAPAPSRVLSYDAMVGAEPFREALAGFLERAFLGRRMDASQMAVLAGAGTVLEDLFYALGDPGDAVLVPTPSYAGFWTDLETRN